MRKYDKNKAKVKKIEGQEAESSMSMGSGEHIISRGTVENKGSKYRYISQTPTTCHGSYGSDIQKSLLVP